MLRYANREDISQIASIYESLDRIHRDNIPEMFKIISAENRQTTMLNDFDDETIRYIVAEKSGEILGFAKLLIKRIPENHPVLIPQKLLHIEEMAVKEKRLGVGAKLIEYAEAVAKELGASALTLQVMKFNLDAKEFYKKTGFCSVFEGMSKALKR